MKARTLRALRASINHWKRLAANKARPGELYGCDSCALCTRFLDNRTRECKIPSTGELCPVQEKSGKVYCRSTPYSAAKEAVCNRALARDYYQSNIEAEVTFLESLLPKDSA